MNWITDKIEKIKLKAKKIFKKHPTGQEQEEWKNCQVCQRLNNLTDLINNLYICECGYHFDLPPKLRLDNLFDDTYEIIESANVNPDPLHFEVGERYKYIDKIKKYKKNTSQKTALICASGNISGLSAVVVCFNPKFGGGRFGPAESEHFLKAANLAVEKKADIWLVVYQSSGIDVHTGVVGLAGGMTKSVIAMNEIKKAGIPTFAIAARAVAGGTYASNFFMHDFILIESNSVENMLFSGKRVTANILKGTDQIPEDFGTGPGVIKAGLADMTLENRKKLKETITKLANIILKKEESEISNEEEFENRQSNIKISSAS